MPNAVSDPSVAEWLLHADLLLHERVDIHRGTVEVPLPAYLSVFSSGAALGSR